MKKMITTALLALSLTAISNAADARFFEMRTYYAAPGKLDALLSRFRDHTCKLFEKHGMTNVGYWLPMENADNKLVYLLAYPSREAREKSWKDFLDDPDWKSAHAASEVNGKLVDKIESLYLNATDFSAGMKPAALAEQRAFELRIYTTEAGRLPDLLARFREHTVKLFEKHGMTNLGYFTPADKDKGAENTLVYFLAHKSKAAAEESFKNFRADPDWIAAKKASEEKAGGSLTIKDGVKSTFMIPADFSPLK